MYLLVCLQEANFGTRSILIPKDLFPEEKLKLLHDNYIENKEFSYGDGRYFVVDRLIIQKFQGDRNMAVAKDTKLNRLLSEINHYAEYPWINMKDQNVTRKVRQE